VIRQDPDVIFIGEIRDSETAEAAISAAETGHLVISTLHTIDATETINRMLDLIPASAQRQARFSLAASLRGTISQRLVQRVDGRGRVPAVEVLVNTGRVKDRILDPHATNSINEVIAEGEFYGMQTFDQALVKLVMEGLVTEEEARDAATTPHDFALALRGMEFGSSSGSDPEGEAPDPKPPLFAPASRPPANREEPRKEPPPRGHEPNDRAGVSKRW
jgi:twitching motility protein PilT